MSDPLRTRPIHDHNTPPIDGAAQRDAKIESLLLSGLDHYFASDYDQAIDVWTRALFLDRQHARARAYIERARSALAEQQRESEELLHNGIAAFERGEIDAARQLLKAAVQRGGAHEVALAFLTRIDRISAAAPVAPAPSVAPARLPLRPTAGARRSPRLGVAPRPVADRHFRDSRPSAGLVGSGASRDPATQLRSRSRLRAGSHHSGSVDHPEELGDRDRAGARALCVRTPV